MTVKKMAESEIDDDIYGFDLVSYIHVINNDLADYGEFYAEVEKLFREKDRKIQQQLSEKLEDIAEENHGEFIDASGYGWDLHQNQFMFPSMHREAIFITLYNFLEYSLNGICKKIAENSKSNISLNDLRGNGIEKAFLYLKKIPEFNFDAANNEVSFIKNVNRLRNVIIHAGGVLPNDEKHKLNVFVISEKHLKGRNGGVVSFESKFIPKFISILQAFFTEANNEIQKYLGKNNL